jgi:Bacterial Ig domain
VLSTTSPKTQPDSSDVGAELTALASVTSGLDSFSFDTSAGTAYEISADGAPGLVTMRLVFSTVQLTGLTDGASIPASRDVPLSAVTTDNDGVITQVEFFVDDVVHGTLTNAPYDLLWINPTQGLHGLVARAVATDGFVRESPTLHITVTPPIAPNDNFTNRTIITGTHASVAGSNYGASKEPDEPTAGGSSVWFTWTAPGAGNLRLQAEAEFYFAYLELFTGETLTNLNQAAASVFRLRPVELRVTPGTAYQIALEESFGDQFGNYQLALDFEPEPANDHFTNRIPVNGVMASFNGSNAGASREPDEPLHTMTVGGKSVWWSWVAPGSGMATITVTGNYPLLAVYAGDELANLTLQVDNQGPPNFTPILFHEVRFRVTTGTAYSIALDTWGGVPEEIELDISFEAAPANDDFVHRIELSGNHVLATAPTNLSLATSEPGEPLTGSGNTVWWTWTPHTNGAVTLTADWLVIGVFTGDVVSSLTEVVSPTGEPTHNFRVTAGTAYQIAAGGREGGGDCPAGCDFRLDFEPTQITITQPPAGSVFYTNEISLEASVEPSFGSVQHVDYFSVEQGFIGSVTNVPYTLPFAGVFEATYGIYARAISTDGRITLSDPITVSFRYPRPANDDFADRAILTGSNIVVIASNGGATTEPGEPSHAGTPPNHSLWWSWTAPANGGVTVILASNPFDTAIQIYIGTTLTNLNSIIGNWSNGEVNFNVVAGREYLIAMNAAGGVGPLSFRLVYQAPPPNDDFANRIMLVGTNVTAHSSTVGASKEPGEPNHAGHPGSVRSIWWSWTAPTTGAVIID